MDKSGLKQAVSHITMPKDMAQRICGHLRQAASQRVAVPKWYHSAPAVAAVLAVCTLTASAAICTYLFHNPTILQDHNALNAVIEAHKVSGSSHQKAIIYQTPASRTPIPLEDMITDYTLKSTGWTSEDTKQGSFRPQDAWSSMDVTDADAPLRARSIYSKSGAVKEEFTAEDPALLQGQIDGDLRIDFAALDTAFEYVPNANLLYTITDGAGEYAGMYCNSLYAGPAEGSYFTIQYTYEPGVDNGTVSAPYIPESDYDKAYPYTNAHGVEFVITAYGDCTWADCATAHSTFSLYGGYLSTQEVETILDAIGMAEPS